jgi:16S rRNA (adenine1518-N6/adenine1519-N6)-dimethyltransferase
MPAPAGVPPAAPDRMLGPAEIRRLLAQHGVRPSKALGQNFVVDPNTVRRIVRLAGVGPGSRVVEIGAGLGSLTLALAATGAQVVAIEVDRHLVPALQSVTAAAPNVSVVQADARRVDWTAVLGPPVEPGTAAVPPVPPSPRPGPSSRWQLVANLPYNVATPLVVELLESVPQIRSFFVMVQREVGERLAAGPGTKAYGAVSVKVAYWATAAVVGTVPPTVFVPRPAVESALVRIDRREGPAVPASVASYDQVCALVEAGFGQRRKMLRRSLAGLVAADAFPAAAVDPSARAEDLDVASWGRLAGWPSDGVAPGATGGAASRAGGRGAPRRG